MIRLEILPVTAIVSEEQEETTLYLPLPKFNGYTAKIAEMKKASEEALKKV